MITLASRFGDELHLLTAIRDGGRKRVAICASLFIFLESTWLCAVIWSSCSVSPPTFIDCMRTSVRPSWILLIVFRSPPSARVARIPESLNHENPKYNCGIEYFLPTVGFWRQFVPGVQ